MAALVNKMWYKTSLDFMFKGVILIKLLGIRPQFIDVKVLRLILEIFYTPSTIYISIAERKEDCFVFSNIDTNKLLPLYWFRKAHKFTHIPHWSIWSPTVLDRHAMQHYMQLYIIELAQVNKGQVTLSKYCLHFFDEYDTYCKSMLK